MAAAKQKILLIEDDAYTRDIYQEVLEEAGYEVFLAIDGREGVVKLEEGGFDLILLDIMMPKLDGISLLREVKDKPSTAPNGPIYLLTNLGHEGVISEALKLGAKGYFIKSDLNPDQLVEKVNQIFSHQRVISA